MIYTTGDTHGNFERFREEYFPEQTSMTKDDYVIVCGDFGGVWDGGKQEQKRLDRLEQLPFTLLFVSGNHENFDLLAEYPVEDWNGGKIQRIRPHVIHLLRGQVFQLQGHSFFTMGGGKSHDIEDGILSPFAEDFREQYLYYRSIGAQFRVNHYSWWKEEMPSQGEYQEAEKALGQAGWKVDYIVTHAAPNHIVDCSVAAPMVTIPSPTFWRRSGKKPSSTTGCSATTTTTGSLRKNTFCSGSR